MQTADMAFFARVADPLVGGTYMTLMNISSIGAKVFKTFSIWLVDVITWRSCAYDEYHNSTRILLDSNCNDDFTKTQCLESGGFCEIKIDGYFIEVAINVIFGIIWYKFARKIIDHLQQLPITDWYVLSNRQQNKNPELTLLNRETKVSLHA